jgi:hypothetical protein
LIKNWKLFTPVVGRLAGAVKNDAPVNNAVFDGVTVDATFAKLAFKYINVSELTPPVG